MPSVSELMSLAKSGEPNAAAAIKALNEHRRALAASLLAMPPKALEAKDRVREIADLAEGAFPLDGSPEAAALLDDILVRWKKTKAPAANVLMAAIALAPAPHFPLPPDLDAVPAWLRPTYVQFLIAQPPIFMEVGEADRYAEHGMAAVALIHKAVVVDRLPDSEALADGFAKINSTMMYFNERPLRGYFKLRSQLLEWLLLLRGYRLGWSFLLESDRPARIGIFHRSMEPGTETFHLLAHLAGRGPNAPRVVLYVPETAPPGLAQAFRPWVADIVPVPGDIVAAVTRMRRDQLDVCFLPNNLVCAVNLETAVGMHRLARVHVVSGASPASPGLLNGDLFLSSETNDPSPNAQHDYEEKLAFLPGAVGHFAYAYDREPRTLTFSRAAIGLPEDRVVFFSGANYYKLTPEMIDVWAKVLTRTPGSNLLLMPFNPHWATGYPVLLFQQRLERQIKAAGLDPTRVKLINRVPSRADLQHVMSLADVYLDSFPYSGACSLVDPLTVGLPIVARAGRALRTAQGAGLLASEGMGEAVCRDVEAYVERAVRLASDRAYLAQQKAQARRLASASPACVRTETFANSFAAFCNDAFGVYAERYARLRSGKPEDALAAAMRAAAGAKGEASPIFQHIFSLDIVARVVVTYLTTLFREGAAKGRVVDLGADDGDVSSPFVRAGFDTVLFEPAADRAAVIGEWVRHYPNGATHQAMPLVEGGAAPKSGKKGGKLTGAAPSKALRDYFATAGEGVEIVRMDLDRTGLQVVEGLGLIPQTVKVAVVEFGAASRTSQALAEATAAMAARGYAVVVLSYEDLSSKNFPNWERALVDVAFDDAPSAGDGPITALFYRKDDATFLAYVTQLFEACQPGHMRPWTQQASFTQRRSPGQASRVAAPAITA